MFQWSPHAGIHSLTVAAELTAHLNTDPQPPLTVFLEGLLETTVTVQVLAAGERALTLKEQGRLDTGGPDSGRWRNSLLYAGDTLAASVTLLWLPGRLPEEQCRALEAGVIPAGKILAPLGAHRVDCRAMNVTGMMIEEVTGQPAAVQSTAVLAVSGGSRVAIAEEFIPTSFAETLAFAQASRARRQRRDGRRGRRRLHVS
jgi:hypothetical protein